MAAGACCLRGLMGTINPFPVALCVGLLVGAEAAEAKAPGRLNDTRQVLCIVDGVRTKVCAGAGQDAEFGRDARFPSSTCGHCRTATPFFKRKGHWTVNCSGFGTALRLVR